MQAKIYDYIKDNEKFSELLVLLKDYKNDEERFYAYNDYYELIVAPNTITIKRVKKLFGEIILPAIIGFSLLLFIFPLFIGLTQIYDADGLGILLAALLFAILFLNITYSSLTGSKELHYFITPPTNNLKHQAA